MTLEKAQREYVEAAQAYASAQRYHEATKREVSVAASLRQRAYTRLNNAEAALRATAMSSEDLGRIDCGGTAA